jgi:multidrug transporter EmrE-like cation transporter
MILTSILGRIVFKEKIGKRDLISIALLVGGILLFMISFVIYGR